MRKIPKTLNIEFDLLIYMEKKGKEIGVRKESVVLNQILREHKEREEENALPKEQSTISVKTIKKANQEYQETKEFTDLKAKHPKEMRQALQKARVKVKIKGGFEKKHKKFVEYLKRRDYLAVQIVKQQLRVGVVKRSEKGV